MRAAVTLLAAALSAHSPAVAQAPGSRAKDAYSRAVALETEGKHAEALVLLWEAAGLAPDDGDIQNRLGEALQRIGALDAAIAAYRQALGARPEFRKAANNLILTLVAAGRGPEAVERARKAVNSSPHDPDAHFTLGLAQSEQDVEGAMGSFRRVLELDPRHALARYNLGLVLKRADRMSEAVAELRRAIEIQPRAEAHYALGVIYWHQGDLNAAAGALRAATAADAGYADAHYTLGAVLNAQGDRKGAAGSLRRALALRPDLAGAHYSLSRVLQASGDADGAKAHLAEAEALRRRAHLEQEARAWTSTGSAKLEAGDVTGAVDHFRRAVGVFEPYAPAHYQLGLALMRLGQRDASRAAFARARALNPSLVPPGDP